jgi:hypothetical protein
MVSWRERDARNEWIDAARTFVCRDASCNGMVELRKGEHETVRAVPNRFGIAVNHENPVAEVVIGEGRRFAVVDKIEVCGPRLARATDPRARGRRSGNP